MLKYQYPRLYHLVQSQGKVFYKRTCFDFRQKTYLIYKGGKLNNRLGLKVPNREQWEKLQFCQQYRGQNKLLCYIEKKTKMDLEADKSGFCSQPCHLLSDNGQII